MTTGLETQSITQLKGVGKVTAARLHLLSIHSFLDLLLHFPSRYQNRTTVTPIKLLKHGSEVLVQGHVQSVKVTNGRRTTLTGLIQDTTGSLVVRFFHFSAYYLDILAVGKEIQCFGKIHSNGLSLELVHPELKLFSQQTENKKDKRLTPVYPTTKGINQHQFRNIALQVLNYEGGVHKRLDDLIPSRLFKNSHFHDIGLAVDFIHRPAATLTDDSLNKKLSIFRQCVAFEELLAYQLCLKLKREASANQQAYKVTIRRNWLHEIQTILPFSLTNSQINAITEIKNNLASGVPMQRLIQGDVGSGKTLVAIIASLYLLDQDLQVALMVPTELLANQHYAYIQKLLAQFKINTCLLTSKISNKARSKCLQSIESGQTLFIIGTQSLIQQQVSYSKLAMVIIDEQHRFGVNQRITLWEKGCNEDFYPHQLIMTATPIPRTLAKTMYGVLDCTVIDELPAGRLVIDTVVIPSHRRNEVKQRIQLACSQGQQAYWVCNMIDESNASECQAALATKRYLSKSLTGINIGIVHGQMKSGEKEKVMTDFKNHTISILVATTVIEVGVDVPNATLMIIENSERLGLLQLHQLRGRIGRSNKKSCCVLLYNGVLSSIAKHRLDVLRSTNDGFRIAEKDFTLRGSGELLGTRQSGMINFKVADLYKDHALIPTVLKTADTIFSEYPECIDPLIKRWHPVLEATQS